MERQDDWLCTEFPATGRGTFDPLERNPRALGPAARSAEPIARNPDPLPILPDACAPRVVTRPRLPAPVPVCRPGGRLDGGAREPRGSPGAHYGSVAGDHSVQSIHRSREVERCPSA